MTAILLVVLGSTLGRNAVTVVLLVMLGSVFGRKAVAEILLWFLVKLLVEMP